MATFHSGDAQLVYEITGTGPDLVLLHPFPLHHQFWDSVLEQLASRYRIFLPDLRAHGDSEAGDGPVTMEKLADDLDRLCQEFDIRRAVFVGVSIGGYALFEFWRRHRERVGALVLAHESEVRPSRSPRPRMCICHCRRHPICERECSAIGRSSCRSGFQGLFPNCRCCY